MSSEVTESAGFYEFLAWLEINKKRIITISSVVAVVAVGVSFLVWRSKQKEIEASAALFQLGMPIQMGDSSPAVAASEYFKVAAAHEGTQAAAMADLLGAGSLYSENKYAEALDQFKKFQTAHPGSVLTAMAAVGAAASLESLGKYDEALQAYQTLANAYPNEPVAAQARVAMGRLYENKKQPEQALKAYDEVIRLPQRTGWNTEASNHKERLLLQFPNLAPTNAPAAAVAPSTIKPNQLATTNAAAPKTNAAPASGKK